ncbi:MAG: cytochrome C oxidase subunit IV family protein [Verrucomicrobiota bacterium]|jgi:cytochrome c oxidase subunit 4
MSNPPSSSPALRVDEQTVEEMRHHVRRYLIVGVALAIGTGLTVWASLFNFGSREINIVVALMIASCKGCLVAGFFMHLISERKMIYSVLAVTAFFFAALMYLTVSSMAHENLVHIR